MYGKPAMACFKYQLYMYGSAVIIYMIAILWAVTVPSVWVISLPPHPTLYRQPSSNLYGSITFTQLEENSSMATLA